MEKIGHRFVGIKRPVGLASFRLFQRLGKAGIEGSALRRRVFAAGGTVDKKLWSENDLTSLCLGFHQVAVIQADLDTKASGDGYLGLALYFYGSTHGDQLPEVGDPDFLKRSIAAHAETVKGSRAMLRPALTWRGTLGRRGGLKEAIARYNAGRQHWRVGMEAKQQMLKVIEELPDDAGVEEALDRLYLLYKVEKGLGQADRGELLSQEEVRERMAKWLK